MNITTRIIMLTTLIAGIAACSDDTSSTQGAGSNETAGTSNTTPMDMADAGLDGDTEEMSMTDTGGTSNNDTSPTTDTGMPPFDGGPPSGGMPFEFKTYIPSSAGGVEGIAIEVKAPAAPGRYPEGAPISVAVMGGWNPNAADADNLFVDHGVISIGWVQPGSTAASGASGGTYDVRGPNSLRALADVLRYAKGELADEDGRLIYERIPFAMTSNVGMMAGSNGGNMAIATLGIHGEEIGDVHWLVAWESPLGDQQANVEFNDNPYYTPGNCTATGCAFDPEFAMNLAWDPNGVSTARHDSDEIANGSLSLNNAPDFDLSKLPSGYVDGQLRLYPSRELGAAIRQVSETLFSPDGLPRWLVINPQQLDEYWRYRDGTEHIANVHAAYPNLKVIHVQRIGDHVQSQPDYPHATTHLLGWRDAGHAWFRLNPDASYQAIAAGSDDDTIYTENDAGVTVAFPGAVDQMVPNPQSMFINAAAVAEVADRTYTENTSIDLDAVLVDYTPSDTGGGMNMMNVDMCDENTTMRCCGDDVCGGPENPQNCPQDCSN